MNLYRITFSHSAPKGTETGMKTYLLAENEEEVYDYIDSTFNFESWKDNEEEGENFELFNEKWEVIGMQTFREKILSLKGEINDEDYDFSDAYYGVTLYGWELVEENTTIDYTHLIKLKVMDTV